MHARILDRVRSGSPSYVIIVTVFDSRTLTVDLRDINGVSVFSRTLQPR
jgi:hypothetical protein